MPGKTVSYDNSTEIIVSHCTASDVSKANNTGNINPDLHPP